MTTNSQNSEHVDIDTLPESIRSPILVIYRSAGLGLYGALIRYAGMPLEKIALYMNSSQVSGKNKLRQAINLAFQDGSKRSILTPYKVVGSASAVAWFLQYSVMGKCDLQRFIRSFDGVGERTADFLNRNFYISKTNCSSSPAFESLILKRYGVPDM